MSMRFPSPGCLEETGCFWGSLCPVQGRAQQRGWLSGPGAKQSSSAAHLKPWRGARLAWKLFALFVVSSKSKEDVMEERGDAFVPWVACKLESKGLNIAK